jgi:creatinine amidohydrolase/Fe(II)-dependent formamide hydrolase-like protein
MSSHASAPQLPAIQSTSGLNKQVVAALLEAAPIDFVAGKVRLLLDCQMTTKSGEKVPDIRAIEAGSKLWTTILAIDSKMAAGDPALSSGNVEGLEDRMMRSPALLEMVQGMCDRARAYHAATASPAKGREVVDAPA